MPAWFIPAIVFVARTAAPYVARSLLGVGARRVGQVTVAQIARSSGLGGGVAFTANMGTQAVEHGSDWSSYNVRAALEDAALTAASVGGGAVLFSGLRGAGLRRFAIEFGGSLGIQAGLGMGRVVINETDPTSTIFAAMVQTPIVYARRKFIIARLVPGGLGSTRGVLIDQGFSLAQEFGLRTALGLTPPPPGGRVDSAHAPATSPAPALGQCTQADPYGQFLDAPPLHVPQFDFQRRYQQCLACTR